MDQPGIEQRPLKMINGVSTEFGQVLFEGARVPAANMVGAPGEGWALAMTVVAHEREPSTLGFTARYGNTVRKLAAQVSTSGRTAPAGSASPGGRPLVPPELAWAPLYVGYR
jgi:alkylation response protein AidB-like acyl-CoA dehydrogenase